MSFDLIGAVCKRCSGVCKLGGAASFDVDQEQCTVYMENKSSFSAQGEGGEIEERERGGGGGERKTERLERESSSFSLLHTDSVNVTYI